ncbi:MAG: precorrin-6Y C5,15-methyltransferase (decarboxylating) subunit CbiT [Caloramator sp.]|nr:precorrin-6Y C5,15-methyltransferase (decarboxylating) subunit CbiT [Caloramator sp.]
MWIRDEDFLRGNVPMTKFEVRAVSLAYLDLCRGDVLLDIGAGTGSISIQAAMFGARVLAIDRDEEAIELIKMNKQKFAVDLEVIKGHAEDIIEKLNFNKCFIGGTGGNLLKIIKAIDKNQSNKIVVANFIKIENLSLFIKTFRELNYEVEVTQVSISKMENDLLRANNPVFIARAIKGR